MIVVLFIMLLMSVDSLILHGSSIDPPIFSTKDSKNLTQSFDTSVHLWKVYKGTSDVLSDISYFSEPYLGRQIIIPNQIWCDYNKLPTVPEDPIPEGAVYKKISNLGLTELQTYNKNAWHNAGAIDFIVPEDFTNKLDANKWKWYVKDSKGTIIGDGIGGLDFDRRVGVVRFYGADGNPSPNLPYTISGYKYIGRKGIPKPAISGVETINSEVGDITIQGTKNQIGVTTVDDIISVSVDKTLNDQIVVNNAKPTTLDVSNAIETALVPYVKSIEVRNFISASSSNTITIPIPTTSNQWINLSGLNLDINNVSEPKNWQLINGNIQYLGTKPIYVKINVICYTGNDTGGQIGFYIKQLISTTQPTNNICLVNTYANKKLFMDLYYIKLVQGSTIFPAYVGPFNYTIATQTIIDKYVMILEEI